MNQLSADIFKAYDIRGIVGKTLDQEAARQIGQAVGSEARVRNLRTIVVGRDGRLSGLNLCQALSEGIRSAGVDVIDVGCVATPMLYFAAHELSLMSGVMVTGSHNPPEYNGFKVTLAGNTLAGDEIQELYQRIVSGDFFSGDGCYGTYNIAERYSDRIASEIKLERELNIVVDSGNGVAGAFAPPLFRRLGCRVRELFCDVDGNFPNHHPDPSQPENLQDLIDSLRETDAEIGLAFDGDGDRLGVVTKEGSIICSDRQLMLFAADVLTRNPQAKIIYDVKSTRLLKAWIEQRGGVPLMARTGHSFIKTKIKETGALLAGEMSGHVFFNDRWYGFDDGMYAGARLLEILSRVDNPSELLNALPNAVSTPELHLKMSREGESHALIAQLKLSANFYGADEVITLDGLRVEYKDGFGLVRASNTTPVLVLRFEADSDAALERIQSDFRRVLSTVTDRVLPF